MKMKMQLPVLFYCLFAFPSISSASDSFSGPIDPTGLVDFSGVTACACPGSSVQYYCTVNDPSGTSVARWRGSAFDCSNNGNQVVLFHDQYSFGNAGDACNGGTFELTSRGLTNITDNCYTSVLTVNIVPELNGRTVECTNAGTRIVGNGTLQVAVPLAPPSSPAVEQVLPDQSFTVSWTPPPNDCGNAVNYTYLTSADGSCGECTNIMTREPSTTCTGWTAIEGYNCGGEGNVSEPGIISFPRPATPIITVAVELSTGGAVAITAVLCFVAFFILGIVSGILIHYCLSARRAQYSVSSSSTEPQTPAPDPLCDNITATDTHPKAIELTENITYGPARR